MQAELHEDFIPLVICYNENISNRVVLDRPDFLKNEVKYSAFSQRGTTVREFHASGPRSRTLRPIAP